MSSKSKVPTPDEIWAILKEVSTTQKKTENKSDILAEENGLFLIRATGDSARLVNQAHLNPKPSLKGFKQAI